MSESANKRRREPNSDTPRLRAVRSRLLAEHRQSEYLHRAAPDAIAAKIRQQSWQTPQIVEQRVSEMAWLQVAVRSTRSASVAINMLVGQGLGGAPVVG